MIQHPEISRKRKMRGDGRRWAKGPREGRGEERREKGNAADVAGVPFCRISHLQHSVYVFVISKVERSSGYKLAISPVFVFVLNVWGIS